MYDSIFASSLKISDGTVLPIPTCSVPFVVAATATLLRINAGAVTVTFEIVPDGSS